MWLIIRTAWRGLARHRRRTIITVTAMAFSLCLAIPTWGLTEGLTQEMLRGITGLELGHVQLHDPAYPRGKALQSTLDRPDHLLGILRATPGVVAAAPRVHGYALASHDDALRLRLMALAALAPTLRFGRAVDPKAPWRADPALACEAILSKDDATQETLTVGTVLTPGRRGRGGRCERIQIVGVSAAPLGPPPGKGAALLALPEADLQAAYGQHRLTLEGLVRHSAAVSVMGVEPEAERRVTFMADRIIEGRYLGASPRGEIVVGYRLARLMKLKIGGKLFLQAAALDSSKGTFYRDCEVVGIYRTGVDLLDRSRVFVHVKDAQTLMTLGDRVHEIAVTGTNARHPLALRKRLQGRVTSKLRVNGGHRGLRAGSLALPAPVSIYEPRNGDAALIVPYDLKRRFEDLPGVAAVARRIYAEARVAKAEKVTLHVQATDAATLRRWLGPSVGEPEPCTLYLPAALAGQRGLAAGETLHPWAAATGQEAGCPRVKVVLWPRAAERTTAAANVPPKAPPRAAAASPGAEEPPGHQALALRSEAKDDKDDEGPGGLEEGSQDFLRAGAASALRLVGVEPTHEPALSELDGRVSRGAYFATQGPKAEVPADAPWPVLLPERVARRLGVSPGAFLSLEARDEEGRGRVQALHLVGTLADARWPKGLPELVLPYYPAQAVDTPRLNAKAHELLLVPKPGTSPAALAKAAEGQGKPLIRTWQEIQPDMAKLIQTQDVWVGIMLFIIFAIAALTVMNTMLMAVWERTREFGVLKALGMRPVQVIGLIVWETLFLALIAGVVGGAIGFALNHWAVVKGIDLSAWTGGFTYQGAFINPVWRAVHTVKAIAIPIVMVELVCLLVSFYPAWRAGTLKPVTALRHQG